MGNQTTTKSTVESTQLFCGWFFGTFTVMLKAVHHVAVICSDYERSRDFYTRVLDLAVIRETYREDRRSHKLDLALNGRYVIELFSFPDTPPRHTQPEACGLRHLAFSVSDLATVILRLEQNGVTVQPVRTDEITKKKFVFFSDPDGLPIELYED